MVNAPTNSAISANIRSAVLRNDSARLTAFASSSMIVCPVTTSASDGRAWAIERCTAALSAPGLATTSMKSKSPVSPSRRCAVGRVNAARVCPARLSAVPNCAIPVMVKVWADFDAAVRIRTRWPTLNRWFCAVAASITTSSLIVGGLPATRCRLEICWSVSQPTPTVPTVDEIGLPSCPMNWAYPATSPYAPATPGTPSTRVRSASGSGLRVALWPLPNWATPRTWKLILL